MLMLTIAVGASLVAPISAPVIATEAPTSTVVHTVAVKPIPIPDPGKIFEPRPTPIPDPGKIFEPKPIDFDANLPIVWRG